MARNRDESWTWRLGRVFASLAKKLDYPASASVPVSAAMLHRVDSVGAGQTLEDAASCMARGTGPLPVIDDDGRPVGVVTRHSLASALVASGPSASISAASYGTVIEVDPATSAEDVLEQLSARPGAIAMVVDTNGSPVGLLTKEQLGTYLESRRSS